MKKLFLTILGVLFLSSMAFAQHLYDPSTAKPAIAVPAAPVKPQAKPVEMQDKTLVGMIETVTMADPTKGIKGELVVVDNAGAKTIFILSSMVKATFAKGEKVEVKYHVTENGVNKATEVMVVK